MRVIADPFYPVLFSLILKFFFMFLIVFIFAAQELLEEL